jgi:hypothetical protein
MITRDIFGLFFAAVFGKIISEHARIHINICALALLLKGRFVDVFASQVEMSLHTVYLP